jgi:PhoPQ-activated pathogenicity-related protein
MKRKISFIVFLSGLLCIRAMYGQPADEPATALLRYLNNGDAAYGWTLRDSMSYRNIKGYFFELVSQQWQGITWRHELTVVVPDKIKSDAALLWITGNDNDETGHPKFRKKTDDENVAMAQIAMASGAVTAVLRQVPNQPLFGGLKESEMMVYTLHQYLEKNDDSWPAHFPMVKSAIKAMDAMQEFVLRRRQTELSRFVVSGGSKRGGIAWLVGAVGDRRVAAIAPAVIDMLRMPEQMDYQHDLFADERNEEEKAYASLGISAKHPSPHSESIVRMIDPYTYLSNITMPKLIILAANDDFWPVDAFRFYEQKLKGDYRLCIVPNAGHALGDKKQALGTLNLFFKRIAAREPYPECKWNMSIKKGIAALSVEGTKDGLMEISLWTATSDTRDFRKSEWTKTKLPTKRKAHKATAEITLPETGYKAFFVELKYKAQEYPGSFTTRTYVVDKNGETDMAAK